MLSLTLAPFVVSDPAARIPHATLVGMGAAVVDDGELEYCMVDAVIELAYERGISLGVEGIPFDDVVRCAGVSMAKAKHRWKGRRDQLYWDALEQLAHRIDLPFPDDEGFIGDHAAFLAEFREGLEDRQMRRDVAVEIVRRGVMEDVRLLHDSEEWCAFRTVLKGKDRIADPQLRDSIFAKLTEVFEESMRERARTYAYFVDLFGFRLVRPLTGPEGFETMSRAVSVSLLGLLTMEDVGQKQLFDKFPMRAFGSSQTAEWSQAACMVATAIFAHIEPRPTEKWNAQRVQDFFNVVNKLGGVA